MLSVMDHTWSFNFEILYSIHSLKKKKKTPKYQITAHEIAKSFLAFYG